MQGFVELLWYGCYHRRYCHLLITILPVCHGLLLRRSPTTALLCRRRSYKAPSLRLTHSETASSEDSPSPSGGAGGGTGGSSTQRIRIPPYAPLNSHQEDGESNHYPSVLHDIYVHPVLTDAETAELKQRARTHAATTGQWQQPDTERHSNYQTVDFPIDSAPSVQKFLQGIDFDGRIFRALHSFYGIPSEELEYLDLFCAQYRAKEEEKDHNDTSTIGRTITMDQLEEHRDGSLLSFTITLSAPQEFEGGGTFFEALRGQEHLHAKLLQPGGTVRPTRAGDGVFHSGKPLHGASVVTKGERVVLVGFVDVPLWQQRPGVLAEACKTWGRLDVILKRHQRQERKVKTQHGKGWFFATNRHKWLPGTDVATDRGKS